LASHYSQKEYKPDPKKAHNGTIEYTSRDAHVGGNCLLQLNTDSKSQDWGWRA